MMPAMKEKLRLMIVAGEPSGDAHAAALARALRAEAPQAELELFGATGALMRESGVESIVRSDDLAIMGIVEVARVLPKFWRAFQALRRAASERRPDAVVLVDWPEFNLRLARSLRRRGLRVIYYISPQLWAWRSYRVRNIRRDVDLLLAILPFEPAWYKARGVEHVEFVGHPLVGEVGARSTRAEFCERHHLDTTRPLVALLPGSRHKELERILPPMLDAISLLSQSRPDAQFVIALAPNRTMDEAQAHLDAAKRKGARLPEGLLIVRQETREALAAADVAAVASGTATLEAAMLNAPMVIVYKESSINWHTLGRLITTEHFGLVNLIAGERIATELMQDDLKSERLSQELLLLLDAERNGAARARLREIAASLGEGGASRRAAQTILKAIRDWKK
ncbi:MAG: lipid-A-disaccharide synthase [Blastocatellia bacterium]|jgi:lipid-A-disaccharide synthase|nr:lipid-A-disaccharide synthase [Blastocatellia bacterium]